MRNLEVPESGRADRGRSPAIAMALTLAVVGMAAAASFKIAPSGTGGSDSYLGASAGIPAGKPAPRFVYTTLDGKKVALKDFAGKALLIDVFSVT
jgi:hypothetical protein